MPPRLRGDESADIGTEHGEDIMGTTATSGWAVLWFLLGFTVLGTAATGGGVLSLLGGAALIGFSWVLFGAARAKEE